MSVKLSALIMTWVHGGGGGGGGGGDLFGQRTSYMCPLTLKLVVNTFTVRNKLLCDVLVHPTIHLSVN